MGPSGANAHSLLFSPASPFSRHQGFGILSVVLANHAIKLLTLLFQDLHVEALHKVSAWQKGPAGAQNRRWGKEFQVRC